ncbi:unnamed protein product [Nippostrongylus brasiliensis]|uniref:Uncharacterized protein n=1 Tax=Nippostrongylus brasiliensis TaxID=27835 RepID=A0A0N4YK22_NIPBR|nr:unnamed protein product [Nippostrongylus brasiliensis]
MNVRGMVAPSLPARLAMAPNTCEIDGGVLFGGIGVEPAVYLPRLIIDRIAASVLQNHLRRAHRLNMVIDQFRDDDISKNDPHEIVLSED